MIQIRSKFLRKTDKQLTFTVLEATSGVQKDLDHMLEDATVELKLNPVVQNYAGIFQMIKFHLTGILSKILGPVSNLPFFMRKEQWPIK